MLYSPDIEDYADTLISHLRSEDLKQRLEDITVEKGDGIILPPFTLIRYGVIDVETTDYPSLYVFPQSEDVEWYNGFARNVHFGYTLEIYQVGDDPEILERQVNRYTRAVAEVLMEKENHGLLTISSIQHPPVMGGGNSLLKGSIIRLRYQAYVQS